MVAQIEKILQAERDGKATIQIIPFDYGPPAMQDSNFVLLEFDTATRISPIVFVEGLTANQYVERTADTDRYKEAIEYLRYSALNARDSVQHIADMRERYIGP
jgi:hypothetical protein